MPEKTIKRRLTETGARELADDDGPIFSTVARSTPCSAPSLIRAISNCGKRPCALGANCYAGPSTRRSDERTAGDRALAVRLRLKMLSAGVPPARHHDPALSRLGATRSSDRRLRHARERAER